MTLEEKYILARWCYAVGENYISDMEYRYIEEQIKIKSPNNEYLQRSWSDDPCPVELLKENGLEKLIRNVEFIHKSESIRSIYDEETYFSQFKQLKETTYVSYKIDGWNTQVNYYNGSPVSANTRGRSGNFMKADVILEIIPEKIPIMGKVKITGEASIPKDKWKLYALETGNTSQRNSVSTVLANRDKNFISFKAFNIQTDREKITEDRYELLNKLGFTTPVRLKVNDFNSLNKAVKVLGIRDEKYNYLTDGLVIENSKGQIALRIYHWREKCLDSYITGYIENRGSYGDSMVVSIYPIAREGIKRGKVGVTNIKYIVENNLQVGLPIAFDIRSAADAVLNTTRTAELQKIWKGRYAEYRKEIEDREKMYIN